MTTLPGTAVGLLVVLVAVLPGSLYTWAFERQVSAYGVTLADRTLRFLAASVLFDLVLAWPAYGLYRLAAVHQDGRGFGQFAVAWLALLVVVAVPGGTGAVLGGLYVTRSDRSGWRWLRRWLTPERETRLLSVALGRAPAPRAWDNLFSERPNVYLRVRLADDQWVGGRFADASYAGGFPHDPDLYLEEAWAVDQASGELLGETGLGFPVYIPAGQIRWMEIEYEQTVPEEVPPDG